MKKELIINASALEVRVALLEDRVLSEFLVERPGSRGLAGNIYKGRVTRVLPGMQAAFVDIGLEKAGFLHVSDFLEGINAFGGVAEEFEDAEIETEPSEEPPSEVVVDTSLNGVDSPTTEEEPSTDPGTASRGRRRQRSPRRSRLPIEQQLRRNQEIIVQIAKEPMGTKGARLTSFISLPGRHLVYMPTTNHIGVSRRIESAEERARLRSAVKEIRPEQGGFIIRTACEGVSKREIQYDISFLTKLWASLVSKSEKSAPASLLYADLDLALRAIRDLFSSDVERLWCDDPATYRRILDFVSEYMPRLRHRVTSFEGEAPIFDHFNIESQLQRALERKVWLKSGGYLVFDRAEALTAVDVNTGRFVGKRNQEETVLKTNLEAAEEVANQLRLRNIGGIIIIDFIDMTKETNRKKVSEVLGQALRRDKARCSMLKISEFGLVQMTRKRTRESLEELLTEHCPTCEGRSVVKSVPTQAADVMRGIQRELGRRERGGMVVIKLNPDVARYLYDVGARALDELEQRYDIKIALKSNAALEPGVFEFTQAPAAA